VSGTCMQHGSPPAWRPGAHGHRQGSGAAARSRLDLPSRWCWCAPPRLLFFQRRPARATTLRWPRCAGRVALDRRLGPAGRARQTCAGCRRRQACTSRPGRGTRLPLARGRAARSVRSFRQHAACLPTRASVSKSNTASEAATTNPWIHQPSKTAFAPMFDDIPSLCADNARDNRDEGGGPHGCGCEACLCHKQVLHCHCDCHTDRHQCHPAQRHDP
jgi:hypothetical protein